MKKIFGLLMIFAGVLTSCQDDMPYHEPEGSGVTLLKKMVVTMSNGAQVTSLYNYDGEKLTSVTHSDGTSETYSYAGNSLTEVRYYNNGGLVKKATYLYTSNAFVGYTATNYDLQNPANNFSQRYEYIVNGDDITINEYRGDEADQNELYQTNILTVVNNNVKKIVTPDGTTQYQFDYKNAPLRNAEAYGVMLLANFEGGINNEIARNEDGAVSNTAYTYTPDEFPATATLTGSENYTITYTY